MRIPAVERPLVATAVSALKAWNRSEGWKSDANMFAPGLHRFIAERMWEDLPEGANAPAPSRYRNPTPPALPVRPEDEIRDPAEIARLLRVRS
jgi:hypothetical protein